jgi:hypothetical protein
MYTDVFISRDWDVDVEKGGRFVHVVSTDNIDPVVSDREEFPPGTTVRVSRKAYLLDEDQYVVCLRVDPTVFTIE